MRYPGGKGGEGVYQTIINQIPPHRVYIESHVGGGAVLRKKRPANISFVLDVDPDVICHWYQANTPPNTHILQVDAATFLRTYPFAGDEFVYLDPPYLMETRKGGAIYNHEYTTEQHIELLDVILSIRAMVMISGYWSDLYARKLAAWRMLSFQAQTRQGTATEWLWMNYPKPEQLHDYRYLGDDFRHRERLKRIKASWTNRLQRLAPLERQMLIETANQIQHKS